MSAIQPFLNYLATVRRRTGGASGSGATLDALNAQVYGDPSTWTTVYTDMPCRLEIQSQPISFTQAGERTNPTKNVLYVSNDYTLQTEDRVVISGITYIAQGIMVAFDPIGGVDHYEITVLIEP